MQKKLISCLLIISSNLFAQITISSPTEIKSPRTGISENVNVGVRFGMNFISRHYDADYNIGYDDQMIYPGLGVSLFARAKISSHLKLIFELGIVQKKNKASLLFYDNLDVIEYLKTNQSFVSIGLLVCPLTNFFINLSPYVGYSSKLNRKLENWDDEWQEDEYRTFEYGLSLNLEYLIKERYLFSAGYSRGKLDSNSQIDPINRGFTLGLGYLIN